jgi:hypothetical protein
MNAGQVGDVRSSGFPLSSAWQFRLWLALFAMIGICAASTWLA